MFIMNKTNIKYNFRLSFNTVEVIAAIIVPPFTFYIYWIILLLLPYWCRLAFSNGCIRRFSVNKSLVV